MIIRIVQLLLFLLPLHGAIVVFGVEGIRYWKEILLVLLGIGWILEEGRQLLIKKSVQFSTAEKASLFFCIWLGILVLWSDSVHTALLAARYIGLGFGVFFLVSRLWVLEKIQKLDIQGISRAFVYGVFFSVLLGLWAHLFGGYEVLLGWYSSSISSWVPGQSTPLYHETAGIIRMQGAASGPVEFAHLLLLGLVVLPFTKLSRRCKNILWGLFLFGIALALTRAVWLAVCLYVVLLFLQKYTWSIKQWGVGALISGILFGAIFTIPQVREVVLRKASSIEHITKPLEVIYIGLDSPILGRLGVAGPAARVHNLKTINDDKAPVAENIFVDYFAQTGLIGLGFVIWFFYGLFRFKSVRIQSFVLIILCVGSLASIFDMTPLSISYFVFLALMSRIRV